MEESLVRALCAQRCRIRARWEDLLRAERVNTPLANPDALVFMLDWTLDEVFNSLSRPNPRRRRFRVAAHPPARADCPCGRNPLLVYFVAGEQALLEALVLAQADALGLDPIARDSAVTELYLTIRAVARREIESFCAVCQRRTAIGNEHLHARPCGAAVSHGADWAHHPRASSEH